MPTESNPIELGLSCPDFQLPSTSGKNKSLSDYSNSKILVVGFTCNHCPYVQAYEERLNSLAKDFMPKSVAFVCINSNDDQKYPEDSFEKMKERQGQKAFVFDYLRDESQKTAKAFNAACTPEFFVYDQDRKLRYHGRIDDNYQDTAQVKYPYMKEVLEDLLGDKKLRWTQTNAIGCSIKWKV